MRVALTQRESSEGEFVPYFQPIVDLRQGKLAGFELVARQQHPTQGVMGPDTFLGAAEKEGWINDLTLQLLERALPVFLRLPGELFLTFNIAAVQLHDLELPENIRDLTESLGFPLDRLTVEVTETAIFPGLITARKVAERFRSLGCRLGLDDFGVGYSSLKTLEALPFNVLKVDSSFVRTMTQNKDSRKIVAAVIGLGQSLGITTIAEGIEAHEQNEMVDWLGCDFGQGSFHGKPVPAEALAETMLEPRANRPPPRAWNGPDRERSLIRFDNPPYVRLAQLRSVYDAVPAGLAFVDLEERYLSINRRLAEINGRDMAAHLGRTLAEMVPEIYPDIAGDLHRAQRGESVLGAMVRGKTPGAQRPRKFLVSYEPARDEAGEIVGVTIAVLEIESIAVRLPPGIELPPGLQARLK